jgi:hypothetical protein
MPVISDRLDSLPDQSGSRYRRNASVSIALEEEIASLPALSKTELLTKWRESLKQNVTPEWELRRNLVFP